MPITEPGFENHEAGAEARERGLPNELWALLRTISSQIDEADQRQTGLLQDLRERLAALSLEAENARGQVPASAAPMYQRIETGLAELAQRINEAAAGEPAPESDAPAVLRSASSGGVPDRAAAGLAGIDPFDLVGDDDEDGAPWTAKDAEALTRIYEESDAALVRTSPRSETAQDQPAAGEASADSVASAERDALHAPSAADDDRAWLDQRLSEIASRIEQSLRDFKGDFSFDSLGVRFDAFEERMGTVLGDVAARSDVDSLRLLESQIQDMALHLEQTEQQLGRLDGIEQQLQAVIDHLSSDAGVGANGALPAAAMPDFAALAQSTAEQVAKRFAATSASGSNDARIDELGSLLRSMIHDRRHSDEQTYTMLDTVQQAMIRLLDRIDGLEMAHLQMGERASADVPEPVPGGPAIQDFGAPEHHDFEPALAPRAEPMPSYMQAPAPAVPPPAPRAEHATSPVDKLRQDFIADAQRAKLRAASAAAETETAASAPAGAAARVMRSATQRAPAAVSGAETPSGGSRRQRLTAIALCLVIAVSGAALFAKSRNKAVPAEPAAVTETVPAPTAAPVEPSSTNETTGEAPQIEVPAAPKAESGAQIFEVPGEEEIVVPAAPAAPPSAAPAPQPEAAAPAAQPAPSGDAGASGGPQTNEEALSFENEAPTGGEILENRSDPERAPRPQGLAPQGIILQDGGRKPSAQELVHLQSQQNFAALSSRLGTSASQLRPADLMPEEVARYAVTPVAATAEAADAIAAAPASLPVAAMPGETIDMPVSVSGKTFSQLDLPPATVGPLSLRLAAAKGDPSAAFEVGARLAEGKGTPQNFQEAIVWYQKSASQGFAQSQYRLGTLYERGLGVKADLARAQMWYQRAAEQGHIKAMHNLAVLAAGRTSGQPDYVTAAQWFQSAAEYGLTDSQYNLAVLHENGLGVAHDPVQAYKWYTLAGRGGDPESLRRRDAIKAALSVEQRLKAEEDVTLFQPKRNLPLVNDARVAGEDWKKRQDG